MNIGDKVIMNDKYVVEKKNRDKVFRVRSELFDVSGTECVLLEGYRGCYAVDGLSLVEKRMTSKETVSRLFD